MSTEAFLIIFMTFWAIITLAPLGFRKFKVPGVIVLLVTGMIIGPNGLGLLNFLAKNLNFLGVDPEVIRTHSLTMVNSLGSLGLVFLMTLAGLEADFKLIKTVRKPTVWLSILTFMMPAVAGFMVYFNFVPDDLPGQLLYASLFASHSVGIVFPVIRELKLSQTRFGAAVLISTVITDIGSIILLAVSVQLKRQTSLNGANAIKSLSLFDYIDPTIFGNWFVPLFLIIAILYMVFFCWSVNKVGSKMIQWLGHDEDSLVTVFLFMIMITVLVGEFFGINLVVGAFIAGLGLSQVVQNKEMLLFRRVESIGYGFLIPFLFVSIGMETDFAAFKGGSNFMIVFLTIAGLVISKIGSGYGAMRLSGFSRSQGLAAGLMTVPQLSATLAAAAIGKEIGLLDGKFFNAIIILSIITTLPVPSLVKLVISKGKDNFGDPEREVHLPSVVKDDNLL